TTMAVAGVAAGLIAYRGAKSLFQIGRGALDLARGSILVARGGARGGGGGGSGSGPVGRAIEALGGAAASAGVQRVFVVNMPGGGGAGGGLGGAAGAVADELATAGKGGSVGSAASKGGRFARVFGAARGVLGRVMPYAGKLAMAGTVLKLGLAANNAYAVATGDDTRAAKAQGFAGIAGSLAGGVLGAKVGAMIGAFGGPVGAAVGGLAGGALGTFAGEKALGAVAKLALSYNASRNDAQQPAVAEALAKAKALEKPSGADKPVAKIDQQNTFAPVFHVTFQGEPGSDAADRFLAKVSPQLQRLMKDELAKNNRSAMFDSPHL
ncbi:phage tail protein, partial [Paraburkholderia sp. SIMBA_050]